MLHATNNFASPLQQKPTAYKSLKLAEHLHVQNNVGAQLSHRYEQLLRSERYTDCVFHICETQVKCHKLILCAASPVFEAMFYGALREHDSQIEIHDISPEIFKVLIEYIYIGGFEHESLTLEECIELYYAAEKYLLSELTTDCLLAITQKLRFSNILPALELTVYMNLTRLFDVCMTFFMRCCVNNTQYMKYLKEHYIHVSKECVKAIIAACKEPHKLLFWYVFEWTQQECIELGLSGDNSSLLINELIINDLKPTDATVVAAAVMNTKPQQLLLAERCYYKACRPFTVDATAHVWRVRLKCDRFISLAGLVLNSRLAPIFTNAWAPQHVLPLEYNETLRIDLRVLRQEHQQQQQQQAEMNVAADSNNNKIWSHLVQKQCTKYNCDLNINWRESVVLTPDVLYELELSWEPNAYGAEYPCSLLSCQIDGIKFIDDDSFSGSLIKGVRYMNLV